MAAVPLSTANPTLADVMKRTDPTGAMIPLVEALQQRNPFINSMMWKEGNLDTGHRVGARNSLPALSWVTINSGIQPTKSTADTYDEGCGMLEGLSSIDNRLLRLNGNGAAFRASEDDAFLAGMANTMESAFFYESTLSNPERILGLSARLGATASKYGAQIVLPSAGGANVNSSIWLIGWGPRSVYGIYPRGQNGGLTMDDKGEQRDKDAAGNVIYKHETLFRWNCGLCVEDYRAIVRIPNIDVTGLTVNPTAGGAFDLTDLMVRAFYQIFDPTAVNLAWYCDRRIAAFLHRQALNKTTNSSITIEPTQISPGVFGKPILHALGYPVYVTDALTNTEAAVS